MAVRYRAVKDGILSGPPYRQVKTGELVILETELKCSWLVPEGDYRKAKPIPFTSHAIVNSAPSAPKNDPQSIKDKHHDSQMAAVREREGNVAKVIEAIGALNPDEDYTTGGAPKTDALSQLVEFPVSAELRNSAFEQYQKQQDGAGSGNQEVL